MTAKNWDIGIKRVELIFDWPYSWLISPSLLPSSHFPQHHNHELTHSITRKMPCKEVKTRIKLAVFKPVGCDCLLPVALTSAPAPEPLVTWGAGAENSPDWLGGNCETPGLSWGGAEVSAMVIGRRKERENSGRDLEGKRGWVELGWEDMRTQSTPKHQHTHQYTHQYTCLRLRTCIHSLHMYAELGPRLKLRLLKIEDGLCGGSVLYHALGMYF